jgi:hypothetical protein
MLGQVVRGLLVLAAIAPLVYSTLKNWPEVRLALLAADWSGLAGGLVILLLMMPLMGIIPWLTLRRLGIRQPIQKTLGLYFVSQLAKYLPGGIWAYPGRMVAYERSGVGRLLAIASVSREVVALFLGAAAAAVAGIFLGIEMPGWMKTATALGVAACAAVAVLATVPAVWRWSARIPLLRGSALSALADAETTFRLGWLGYTLPASLVFWAGAGLGFLQLVRAVVPTAPLGWLEAGSLFALAWCVGFVVFFLPAGLGARELALSLLLGNYIGAADALTIAMLARLWWMAAEAAFVAIAPFLLAERSGPPHGQ